MSNKASELGIPLPLEHKLLVESCMRFFEGSIPNQEARIKRMDEMVVRLSASCEGFPLYQVYLALRFCSDEVANQLKNWIQKEMGKHEGGNGGEQAPRVVVKPS